MDTFKSRISSFLKLATVVVGGIVLAFLIIRATTSPGQFWHQADNLDRLWRGNWPFSAGSNLGREFGRFLRCGGRLSPATRTVEAGVTMVLDPQDLVGCAILVDGVWEPEIVSTIRSNLPEGGVFVDVGAHIGSHSLLAATRVGSSGKVVAFEPNPRTLELLRRNIELSRASNIIVEPVACSDAETSLVLFAPPALNSGATSLSQHNAEVDAPGSVAVSYRVPGRPLDNVLQELNLRRVDVLKIDVEGAELSVLRGARITLKRFHPMVVIEEKLDKMSAFGATPEALHSLMRDLGYQDGRMIDSDDFAYLAR